MYASPSVTSRPLPPSPNDSFHPPPLPEKYHSPLHSQPGSSRPSFSNEGPSLPPMAVWDPPPPHDSNNRLDTPADSTHTGFPSSPISPSVPTDGQLRAKKANPLQDLLDSEDQYVQIISAIIRKVASAWSRSNFPPPELDAMFRGIEAVFKANRSFLNRLKEIGPNPSSPKALGDLLMHWIEELEAPYTRYCDAFATGFDEWDEVRSNPRLPQVLSELSESIPLPSSESNPDHLWTLDRLFLQPRTRLKYYKKLYARLLKSTKPGRSDHSLLLSATETLDRLFHRVETRLGVSVTVFEHGPQPTGDSVEAQLQQLEQELSPPPPIASQSERRDSHGSSQWGSGTTDQRSSRDTAHTSLGRSPPSMSLKMPVVELERRLSTERVLDIFTMQPKQCRLQMSPPGLPFTRAIRFSVDVVIHFTPRATGQEIYTPLGHIFLLTDLFLVCERMSDAERSACGPDDPDMYLSYPPLSGKHLRVSDVAGPPGEHVLQIVVMKKEMLYVHVESAQVKEKMLRDFQECIDAGAAAPKNPQPPPPMPPPYNSPMAVTGNQFINDPSRPPSAPIGNQRRLDPTLPGGFGPSSSDPRSHASDPPMVRMQSDGSFLPARNASLHDSIQSLPPMGGVMGGSLGPGMIGGPPPMHPGMGPSSPPPGMGPGPGMFVGPPPGAFVPLRGPSNWPGPPGPPGPSGSPGPPMNNVPMRAPPGPPFGGFPPGQGPPPHFSPFPPQAQGPSRGPSPAPPMMGPPGPPHIRKSPSVRSVGSSPSSGYPPADEGMPLPPLPQLPPPGNFGPPPMFPPPNGFGSQIYSNGNGSGFNSRASLASSMTRMSTRHRGPGGPMSDEELSPPGSPIHTGPVTSAVSAQMRCKVFLKQQHQQWKNLGAAKLKLYHQSPTNVKQLVVEADTKEKTMLISTIVLSDGVERVGKTGVAIELSDQGARTGIVYMIQLRNETSASGLFDSLLAGSDRTVAVAKRQG